MYMQLIKCSVPSESDTREYDHGLFYRLVLTWVLLSGEAENGF